jgi:isoleucyl-tRNA synthetase
MNKNNQKQEEGVLDCDAKKDFVGDTQPEKAEDFPLSQTALDEKDTLQMWDEKDIFQKSIDNRDGKKEYVFYDGPPFGTGIPHYGHIVPGTIKDVIPRYKTMAGFKVDRKWGWDCHGLPVENMIEKEIGLNSKKDIEEYGIDNFNKKCKESVLRYDKQWKETIPKTGRWVDMENPYKTMDANYTESLWWAFSELDKKNLVSKDFKPMHVCPRCETTLSNNEVTEGYKDIKDLTVTAKFELIDETETFVLAWTTTPWTLPGNVALAVGKNIEYVKTKNSENTSKYIFAKDLFEKVQKESGIDLEITEEFTGSDLLGKSYLPLFDYYSKNQNLENRENGWKIYEADFVTTDAGTGIVHIAPAFGEDDLKLGKEYDLPWVQHVGMNGEFAKEVVDFAGLLVRKKDFHEESDIEIIKHLAHTGKLFFKEKYEHSYPHCWRCDTPLLNYATSSWFINSPKIKDQLLAENKKISWVPSYIGEKRFHNWLEGTRDWAVSRSRYWGSPLPVWESADGDYKVIGSLSELKSKTRSTNNFTFVRHGESESNIKKLLSSKIGQFGDTLTANGKLQIEETSKSFSDIDIIISSPFGRTKQSAEILATELGIEKNKIIFDSRIGETDFGEKVGNSTSEFKDFLENDYVFDKVFANGESARDMGKRVMEFVYETDEKYKGKNILVVSHGAVIMAALKGADGLSEEDIDIYVSSCKDIKNAGVYPLYFAPIPHNSDYELDYHRPFIDKISFTEEGKKYEHIKEVFDCWFESGAMPFASRHYPFENSDSFNPEKGIGYPADFISEGQDQTRGWFNSMLILSTALFGKAAYKNVVVHGMLMAEDGKKMSKSLKNYPPTDQVLNSYGADSLRMFLLNSSIMKGDSPAFLEKGVDEIMKKVIMKTKNILAFYDLYKTNITEEKNPRDSKNVLDKWILEKTRILVKDVTSGLESYQLDVATKPFIDFVDDFSTWYVRRSRDRFKSDDIEDRDFALATTEYVLKTFAKTIAPIAPFLAEHLWQSLKTKEDSFSVHLTDWPVYKKSLSDMFIKNNVLEKMNSVREIVSLGMESRTVAGLKVRQPLQSILVVGADKKIGNQYSEIILDELNIKNIIFESNIDVAKTYDFFVDDLKNTHTESSKNMSIFLNKEITPELQKEGNFREFLRQIQIMRKQAGLQVHDSIDLKIDINQEDRKFIDEYKNELEKTAGVKNIIYSEIINKEEIKVNGIALKVIIIEN